ncbi:MAG: c-type cytochrome [Burkholderiales bacterium]|nr:c-type cytochrome [Burkholderiales bacterium]MDE1927119.1 c-type cytochrome [Burkholderiales bacterium]MDE2079986.1 c-type cytochrome [Burkholderiales bacterium]MDE2504586.1 c-type cytochrome [Burkholderiales bacterium]
MSSWLERAALALLACTAVQVAAAAGTPYPGIGRSATPAEVAAWNIDVRPDFQGLPPGSGSVAQGQDLWEARCSSCHGVFGESNQVFSPLVGGTTAADLKTGHVARLLDPGFPDRTTLMKVATVSTLWDYIRRAMPWNAPKSLTPDQVYAVLAYLLNLGGIVPDNYTLSNANIGAVRMPNRNGMTTDHGLWPGKGMGNGGHPDVQAVACMRNCDGEPKIISALPDFARNAHGNLSQQNRSFGAQRGADTSKPPPATLAQTRALAEAASHATLAVATPGAAALALARSQGCTSCHDRVSHVVGPPFVEIAARHRDQADLVRYLAGKIRSGGSGVWGDIPMPPQTLPETELQTIAQWLAQGAAP